MNYSGNMPDWHQYNPPQPGINDVTSTAQNVNSGHLSFISSISPTCPTQLNSLNLSSEGLEKHQNDTNFNPRHFQPHLSNNISHGHNAADNPPLASMVQMQNCIGHYGSSSTRNSMVDNMNGPMDPRNTAMGGLNEEVGYRNNQVPLNGPISHLNGSNVMNMNASHGSIGPRNTNVNSHTANRTGAPPPSFVPCKGLCCNPDPNMGYHQQWEKYCSYQNNANYRENIRTTAGYPTDARRFGSDFNFRKDNFDGKEVMPPMVPNGSNVDHRRNFSDFKYRKDRLLSRNYPSSSSMLQNYPMQNYNYTAEYQKYPYNVKEYSKVSSMNVPSQGMVKHQEQSFAMTQQKYNHKQVPYQNSGAMMPSGMPSTSVSNAMIPSTQNTYFNSQYPRNLSTDTSHDCQEVADNAPMVNRMQTSTMHNSSHPRYQMYQQKIAMQRFSMENHLRDLSKIPGYQSHPRYKEYLHRHREILKLQQSVTYQGQIQQTPTCVTTSTSVNASNIPPINLQFDQNGVLINSNYMTEAFPRIQQAMNPQMPMDSSVDKQGKQPDGVLEMMSHNIQKPEQFVPQRHDGHATVLCSEGIQKQDRYPAQKNHFEMQKTNIEAYSNLGVNATDTAMRQKMSKEFADKPELDVRQFLANWDESEDEDGASANAILSDSTPVVVVGYENVDISAKTLKGLEGSKPEGIASGVITFENQDKANIGVVSAQDCLTISYSSAENVAITKDPSCKEITKESIVRSGGHIIQCISNGPDEVPTIHIVDNLEIGSILQVTNGQVTETLQRQNAFFQERTEIEASVITLEADKFKKTDGSNGSAAAEYTDNLESLSKEKYIAQSSSPSEATEDVSQTPQVNHPEMAILPTSIKNNLDSAQDANLKKQSSFASEESHNPDDISLPDLPTSECTPISTTLNTPIHSDNEESSEHVEDLTISTNPIATTIEIIQNSPMISFTQSPTEGEPYDHLSDEGTIENKSSASLDGNEYQTRNHFKNDKDNDILDHDAVLDTFEISADIDKNECNAKNVKELASGNSASACNNEKVFSMDDVTGNAEVAGVRMIVTSGGHELKIVSTEIQNKSTRDYKNSIGERDAKESQVTATKPDVHKKLQVLPEMNAKTAPRYSGPTELGNALQNIANNPDPVKFDGSRDDINYSERSISNELTHQTITTSNTISLSSADDATSRNSRPAVEDNCITKVVKNNPSTSRSTKHTSSSSDKLRKGEKFTGDKFRKEDSSSKKRANSDKSAKIDAKDLKNCRHVKLADCKKSILCDQIISHKKRYSSENIEKCGEIIIHHNKHTRETATRKEKSCSIEGLKQSNISHNKPIIIDNVNINDGVERMRLLKEYRRMKYKSSSMEEIRNKSKDTQKVSDSTADKKCHISSNSEERSGSQSSSDKHLCQKNMKNLNSTEEQETKCPSVLKTFAKKNINPDFAIQVTNVNLKLKDDEPQNESQHLREEAKNNSSLDAIKIEINVSCTERNTTEKLLHENIKNAVAETIGHLTSSISQGARSNSTSITEIQCDKKIVGDQMDCHDYEGRNRSPPALMEASTYNDVRTNENDAEIAKHQSTIIACKENATKDEIPNSLTPKKRCDSLSERELISDIYEDNGNVNINAEPEAASSMEISKSEHAIIRKRSSQDVDRKIVNLYNEESKIISDNIESTSRNIVQKKEHQEMTAAPLCKNARSLSDDVACRSNAISSISNAAGTNSEDVGYSNPVNFDYDHFDVAPNEGADADDSRIEKWKKPKRDDDRFSNYDPYKTVGGYVNPSFFSANELENLNIVPVYTTKDGKITYSPNPRFTYRELIMESKESYGNAREPYFARSMSYDYYHCSKLRKIFKRNREVTGVVRKKEIENTDVKPAAKHIDYLSNKNATYKNVHCAKIRNTSHLEFFNDDADKLYINRNSQQEVKDSNKDSIVDLSFAGKENNVDGESASNINHCKTKIFEIEKGYNESSVFDSNLFMGPRASCWEETMESVKSYSSHIDRRNNDNFKKLNFSEIFSSQKQLNPLLFLSVEQNPPGNDNHKIDCNITIEPILHHTLCNYTDDLNLIPDVSRREQSNTVSHNEEENIYNSQNNASEADNNKSTTILNVSLNMQENDEYTKKQEPQSDGIKSNVTFFTEEVESCSKVTDEKIHASEKDKSSINYIKDKETLIEHLAEVDMQIHCLSPKDNRSNTEDANVKQVSDKSEITIDIASLSKSDSKLEDFEEDSKNLSNDLKCTETVKEIALPLNEQYDEINDVIKINTIFVASEKIVYKQVSSIPTDGNDKEEITPTMESDIFAEIDFDQTNKQDNMCQNSTICKENESIALQEPPAITSIEQSIDEGGSEERLQKLTNDEQKSEVASKDQESDEMDNCNPIISTSIVAMDLHTIRTENDVCDLFTSEKREQNISEFTVIKSIIKGDKTQYEESETKKNPRDCDSIIDSKLLCIDSSDCAIYAEERCALTQMSEHGFTEEDSIVPMEWETSQIQEEAVNRLCSIDESSIDFAGAATSLQDSSLLDNLSLSSVSAVKKSRISEAIVEIENKSYDESVLAIESTSTEKSTTIPSNDESKERNQVSSDNYEKVTYLSATDCNANTKMVPKLVIKKSEASSKFITRMSSPSSVTQMDNINKSFLKLNCQPKIPKMIIRNARSRPGTPSIEAVREQVPQMNISDRTLLTNEELCENDSENSLQESCNYRNKIPKMKIKLDEKHSNKIIRAEDITECSKRKNVKKTVSKESKDTRKERYEEKIPVLKLKKQERNRSSSPEVSRKRQSSSYTEVPFKKYKKSGRDEIGHFTRRSNSSDSTRTECETKKNTIACISEKIPKVIIKRTSASAEFKCELSKNCKSVIAKSAMWQPEVKLERYRILDKMVKELKSSLSPISIRTIDKIFASRKNSYHRREGDYKLSRSNSTSDLLPIKCKQRRMSDYDCGKTSDTIKIDLNFTSSQDTNSKNNRSCITQKKNIFFKSCNKLSDGYQKNNKRKSKSHDNNSEVESDVATNKHINQPFGKSNLETITSRRDKRTTDSLDIEHERGAEKDTTISSKFDPIDILVKHSSNSTNLKLALKELKTTSKIDTRFAKLSDLNDIFTEEIDLQTDKWNKKERDDDPLSSKNNKIVIKKERLNNSNEMDNYCTLQDDFDSMSMLDNFEINKSSIIKIESSDESQSTIEILPASLNHSELDRGIIDDGDSEQLYPADAIPTQFELELDIADNSNANLLDISMPKLDPITCYSPCYVSAEKSCSDQALKVECYNKSETSTCRKDLFGTDELTMEMNINDDDRRSVSGNNSAVPVKEISSKSSCDRTWDSTVTKETFCCNDSLIKEVMAAKETLKKCLSKSKCEFQNNAKPTITAEKKQSSCFDLKDLSKTHPSDARQESRSEVRTQEDITLVTSKQLDKSAYNTAKSDKRHSKQKILFAKKKSKSPEKNDKVNTKESIKNTREYSTISLKAFKQFGKTASKESLTRTVYLSEKRKKNPTDQNSILQLQDSQWKRENKMSSYKIPKISKSAQGSNAGKIKSKEDNMPILKPENTANFDASSDRDNSRSPPVITIQDNEDLDMTESKLQDDKVILSNDKVEDGDTKNIRKKSEMSIDDFITQLAYHEKATINHNRYCNLCEKWFPTTSRHRRHLTGYQHRHIELTQRRSIHALFMLFTGKPCPKLLPANVVRNDCTIGELTPLQIAVQDVTKSFDRTQQSPKKQNNIDK